MTRIAAPLLFAGAILGLSAAWVGAQDSPESLLPPGFDEPRAPTRPSPAPPPAAALPRSNPGGPRVSATSSPVVQPLPAETSASVAIPPVAAAGSGSRLPSLEMLEKLSPDQLEDVLGLKPKFDIPPNARRSAMAAGVIDEQEGGMAVGSLAAQDATLVRAAIAGNNGMLVSRWGHILLRRALASRLAPPLGMDPADFAALRAALLVRMGEAEAARALVQDIDSGDYTSALTAAALDAYVATADFTGICPAVATHGAAQGDSGRDPRWQIAQIICSGFQGDGAGALTRLDRALYRGVMPRIDMLLAQKYVGAAGKAQRAVTIEWDGVDEITPWRYGLAIAVGVEPPARLMDQAGPRYSYIAATAPMLGLASRAAAADRAAGAGILSSAAMVDLYSQLYSDDEITGDWSDRAGKLRDAYLAASARSRLAAMRDLWGSDDPLLRYSRQVLTAYAAARLPIDDTLQDDAGDIIVSMLSAGLDANAVRWAGLAKSGSEGWALLAVADPDARGEVGRSAIDDFTKSDASPDKRKSAFLLAGLAGLGRVSSSTVGNVAGDLKIDLAGQTRWTGIIDRAAAVDNPELVALLAGLGMQGQTWDKMTPRFLYHIVAALRRVGLEPEARMIAAEAVARG
ncbi:MAG: hypothetical protein ABIT04_13365 [Novosphingobium sp.]